ncbi:hypothetical protein [Streptomyces yaizuensis]|uniref:Integral membrane protein n=1 Tax=Streptomyces yaizuensis TaxID=2989713 RepID=A0ABQ5P6L1_9ACTN|nr:hypothetical protein [Streptomyces sp. YSPA8]GLF98199.1 hypothetical protein SYYSPA8_27900 [Streptomyces sp. YSPA8]
MHEQTRWLLTLLASMALLLSTVGATSSWTRRERDSATSMLLGGALLSTVVFFPHLVTGLMDNLTGSFPEHTDESADNDEQPTEDPGTTPAIIPWRPVATAAGAVLTLATALAILHSLRRRHQRQVKEHLRRTGLAARHDKILDAYADFATDILAVLDRPALADVTAPGTVRLLNALDAARDARTDPRSDYGAAVRELELAWKTADRSARKHGTGSLPSAEQRAVGPARLPLATAFDEGGDQNERRHAHHRAMRLIEHIADVPEEAAGELTGTTRLSPPPQVGTRTTTLKKTKKTR